MSESVVVDPLAGYEDWPEFLRGRPRLGGDDVARATAELLGVPEPLSDRTPRVVAEREASGVRTVELAWSVGFGPDLHAWLLHPADADPADLPGVLALHSHGGLKSIGATRLVAPPLPGAMRDADAAAAVAYRERYEDGRAFATDLAAAGFTVLAPDAFSWGSRRFALAAAPGSDTPYDELAAAHEHELAKLCAALDTTYPGMVAHDDLSALAVLATLCRPGPLGVAGFSGGGGRAAALCSLSPSVGAAVVAGMMARLADLPPRTLVGHSWLLHPRGLATGPDLPGLAAARGGHQLLVCYDLTDPLFTERSMTAADAALTDAFGAGSGYRALWSRQGHVFGRDAQRAAADHLAAHLHPLDASPHRSHTEGDRP